MLCKFFFFLFFSRVDIFNTVSHSDSLFCIVGFSRLMLGHSNIDINKSTMDDRMSQCLNTTGANSHWTWLLKDQEVTMAMSENDAKTQGLLENRPCASKTRLNLLLHASNNAIATPSKTFGTLKESGSRAIACVSKTLNGLFDKGDKKTVKCVDPSRKWFQTTAIKDTGEWFPVLAVEHFDDKNYFQKMCPGETAFTFACRGGHLSLIELLMKQNAEHVVPGCVTTVWAACDAGREEVLQLLLKERPEVVSKYLNVAKTSNNMTPLIAACLRNHTKVALLLLEQKDIDIHWQCDKGSGGRKMTALIAASKMGNYAIVQKLLQMADDDSEDKRTSMLVAKDFKNRDALTACMVGASSGLLGAAALRFQMFIKEEDSEPTTDRESIIQSIRKSLSNIDPSIQQQIREEADRRLVEDTAAREANRVQETKEMEEALTNLNNESKAQVLAFEEEEEDEGGGGGE